MKLFLGSILGLLLVVSNAKADTEIPSILKCKASAATLNQPQRVYVYYPFLLAEGRPYKFTVYSNNIDNSFEVSFTLTYKDGALSGQLAGEGQFSSAMLNATFKNKLVSGAVDCEAHKDNGYVFINSDNGAFDDAVRRADTDYKYPTLHNNIRRLSPCVLGSSKKAAEALSLSNNFYGSYVSFSDSGVDFADRNRVCAVPEVVVGTGEDGEYVCPNDNYQELEPTRYHVPYCS